MSANLQYIVATNYVCIYKGLVFCSKCGSISRYSKLGHLAQICEPPAYYGKGNLSRLDNGFLPINVNIWPTDAEAGTQYNILEMFGDFSPEHRETIEAIAYQLHHMSQQALHSPPLSPYLSSVSNSSMCVDDSLEVEAVGLNGEEDVPMLSSSDSD